MQTRPLTTQTSTGRIALAAAGGAVLLWSCLPALRIVIGEQPPFLTATIALVAAAVMETLRSRGVARRRTGTTGGETPLSPGLGAGLALGLVGAIGFYFIGLDLAPAAQVTLITYVWPLMFVVASEIIETRRLRAVVIGGSVVAFAGSAVLVLGTGDGTVTAGRLAGYLAGVLSGVAWVVHSLMLRRGGQPGPDAWPRIFALAAIAAGICHVAFEPVTLAVEPLSLAVAAAIGVGPYGLAFIAWAHGVAEGPPRIVGLLPYGVPVLATGVLAALGATEVTWTLLVGAALVIAGIALASREAPRREPVMPRPPRGTGP